MRQDLPSRLLGLLLVLGAVLCAVPPARAGVNWWTPVGPEGGWIFDMEVDPQTRVVYAGLAGGVFRHPLNDGLPEAPVHLVLDPQNPRKLSAGRRANGVYVHERR